MFRNFRGRNFEAHRNVEEKPQIKVSQRAQNHYLRPKIRFFADFTFYMSNILEKGQNNLKTPSLIYRSWKSAETADLSKIENLRFLAIFKAFFRCFLHRILRWKNKILIFNVFCILNSPFVRENHFKMVSADEWGI